MPAHLLAFALGPAHEGLQEFIGAARRCHDLWFGSWLIADLSKAAARGIAEAIGPGGHQVALEDLSPTSPLTVVNFALGSPPDGIHQGNAPPDAQPRHEANPEVIPSRVALWYVGLLSMNRWLPSLAPADTAPPGNFAAIAAQPKRSCPRRGR